MHEYMKLIIMNECTFILFIKELCAVLNAVILT